MKAEYKAILEEFKITDYQFSVDNNTPYLGVLSIESELDDNVKAAIKKIESILPAYCGIIYKINGQNVDIEELIKENTNQNTAMNIQANELRIGNLISYRGEKINIVTSLGNTFETVNTYNELVNGSDDLRDYEPISLTEEWLLKFGFERKMLCWVFNKFTIAGSLENGYGLTGYCIENVFPKECKFVHELQNLYFALTGEELTIKQ